MIRYVSFSLLILVCLSASAQVTFYGKPEAQDSLNSPSGENYLFIENTGSVIYFTREKHPDNVAKSRDDGDIWKSTLDSTWSSPQQLKLNDRHFTSPIGLTPDGEYLLYNKVWFDKSRYYGGVFAVQVNNPGKEISVDVPYLKNRSPLQTGSLSADGRYLLVSLENNSGYGVDDLYVSFLQQDGSWSPVKNLGRKINTQFQELTPFLAADNRTLFFATNGRGGQGSFDLFKSIRQDDTWQNWSEPENLGSAINTSGSETSFVFAQGADYAYFVSTQNSDGYGDIKRIKITADIEEDTAQQVTLASPTITPEYEKKSRPVSFKLMDSKSGVPLSGVAVVLSEKDSVKIPTEAEGLVSVPYTGDNVSLAFKATGYLSSYRTIDQSAFLEANATPDTILLEPLATGNTIALQNVLFYRGTANFVEGSERELGLVVEMMKENPDVNIFLKGHTDNVGNAVLNVQLSQARVDAVMDFLTDRGISADRISGKGYGGAEPVASNETEETRKLNRRVEFEIRRK